MPKTLANPIYVNAFIVRKITEPLTVDMKQLSREGSLTGTNLSYVSKNISASAETKAMYFPLGATLCE
jgi:hypothetical protein